MCSEEWWTPWEHNEGYWAPTGKQKKSNIVDGRKLWGGEWGNKTSNCKIHDLNTQPRTGAIPIIVEPTEKILIVKDDPKDNIFIETAVGGNVDYIVSQDNHLLKLKEFRGIKIVTPEEFNTLLK